MLLVSMVVFSWRWRSSLVRAPCPSVAAAHGNLGMFELHGVVVHDVPRLRQRWWVEAAVSLVAVTAAVVVAAVAAVVVVVVVVVVAAAVLMLLVVAAAVAAAEAASTRSLYSTDLACGEQHVYAEDTHVLRQRPLAQQQAAE